MSSIQMLPDGCGIKRGGRVQSVVPWDCIETKSTFMKIFRGRQQHTTCLKTCYKLRKREKGAVNLKALEAFVKSIFLCRKTALLETVVNSEKWKSLVSLESYFLFFETVAIKRNNTFSPSASAATNVFRFDCRVQSYWINRYWLIVSYG